MPQPPPLPRPAEGLPAWQWAAQPPARPPVCLLRSPPWRAPHFPANKRSGLSAALPPAPTLTASYSNVRLSPRSSLWKDPAGVMRGFLSTPSPVDVRAEPRTPGDPCPVSGVRTKQPSEDASVSGSLSGVSRSHTCLPKRLQLESLMKASERVNDSTFSRPLVI